MSFSQEGFEYLLPCVNKDFLQFLRLNIKQLKNVIKFLK